MANGDIILEARHERTWKLIDAISATSDGAWIDTGDFKDGSITVSIATTATVQIRGSDIGATDSTPPATATSGQQLGSDITASACLEITNCPRWIKAKISAWTSGAVNVNVTLRRAEAN